MATRTKLSRATISSVAALLGAKGGRRRAKNLTKAERLAGARKASMAAAKARRARRRRQVKRSS